MVPSVLLATRGEHVTRYTHRLFYPLPAVPSATHAEMMGTVQSSKKGIPTLCCAGSQGALLQQLRAQQQLYYAMMRQLPQKQKMCEEPGHVYTARGSLDVRQSTNES